jgi:hypothetical protein
MTTRRLAFSAVLLGFLGLAACDEQGDRACFAVPDSSPRAARGGGWDANGTTLQGVPGASGAGDAPRLADLDGVRLELAGSGGEVRLEDGRLVAEGQRTMLGALLRAKTSDGRILDLRIDAIDEADGIERVALTIDGVAVCEPGDAGIFVEGRWDDHGTLVDAAGLTYACGSGVITKCAAWGYAPWTVGTEIHQACTRMARADYCGDGSAWTQDGTMIDAYDSLGVQAPILDPALRFEAAWGPDGALCVAETRYEITQSDGERVMPACFATLPACDDLEAAAAHGAVLASRTTYASIDACE